MQQHSSTKLKIKLFLKLLAVKTNDCYNFSNKVTSFSKSFNADEAEIYGLETSLQYQIIPEWDIKASYTFTESEITKGDDKGYALESTAKHLLNLTSTWHINDAFDIWLHMSTNLVALALLPNQQMPASKALKYKQIMSSLGITSLT